MKTSAEQALPQQWPWWAYGARKVRFVCLSHPIFGNLLWHKKLLNTNINDRVLLLPSFCCVDTEPLRTEEILISCIWKWDQVFYLYALCFSLPCYIWFGICLYIGRQSFYLVYNLQHITGFLLVLRFLPWHK